MDLRLFDWSINCHNSFNKSSIPEGVFLAILIMNMFAPLIDYYVVQANIKMRLARNA